MKKLAMILGLLALAGVIVAGPLIHDWFCHPRCSLDGAHDCINNLRFLEGVKEQWFLEEHKGTNDVPTMADLAPYMTNFANNSYTSCPLGGVYSLGKVCESPRVA